MQSSLQNHVCTYINKNLGIDEILNFKIPAKTISCLRVKFVHENIICVSFDGLMIRLFISSIYLDSFDSIHLKVMLRYLFFFGKNVAIEIRTRMLIYLCNLN